MLNPITKIQSAELQPGGKITDRNFTNFNDAVKLKLLSILRSRFVYTVNRYFSLHRYYFDTESI